MLFVKYFNPLFLSALTCVFPQVVAALSVEKKCGQYIFQVKISNEADIFERHFELYYQRSGYKKKLFYKTDPGIGLDAACIQNKKKQYLMLFQESCGGNGCSEEVYGIFDPDAKKMLIKAANWSKGNRKEVQQLIGYDPPFYTEDIFFCCYKINIK